MTTESLFEKLSPAARENLREVGMTGVQVLEDYRSMVDGETSASLLARCLDGADDDRRQGWEEYVATIETQVSLVDHDLATL